MAARWKQRWGRCGFENKNVKVIMGDTKRTRGPNESFFSGFIELF